MPPLVSVLVNTYNHERFIAQALQSVLDQDFPASQMEIIVVDDGFTDSTSQIIQAFLPRIRYIRKDNGGQVSAFNAGVCEARGDIVAFLDGVNGFLAKAPTVELLDEAMNRAWENRHRLKEMGEQAAIDVRKFVSPDPTEDFVRELYALVDGTGG